MFIALLILFQKGADVNYPDQNNFCLCFPLETPEQEFKRSELVIEGLIIQSEPFWAAGILTSNKRGIKINHRRYLPDSSEYIKHTVLVQRRFKSPPGLSDTIYIIAKPIENCGPPIQSYTLAEALQSPDMLRYLFYVDAFQEYKTTIKIEGKKPRIAIETIKHQNIFLAERCRRNKLILHNGLEEIEQILPLVDSSVQK